MINMTSRQLGCCRLIVAGHSQLDAYRQAFGRRGGKNRTAVNDAARLARRPEFRTQIRMLEMRADEGRS